MVRVNVHRPRVLPLAEAGDPGFVYFIQAGKNGPIKIGWTTSLEERIDALQTGCPFRLRVLAAIEGTKQDEAAYHRQFAEHRMRGEWFKNCEAIRDLARSRLSSLRRPCVTPGLGERCGNCQALLVLYESELCKACIEFMDDWATPEFKEQWRERWGDQAA